MLRRLFSLLEGPTRKPRHASVFSTRSDTQAVPAFHCIPMFKGIFSTRYVFKTRRHAVYHCLKDVQNIFDTLVFLKRAFRHARVHFYNARFRPSKFSLAFSQALLGEILVSSHWVGVLSHHLRCEMKSPHLVDFS